MSKYVNIWPDLCEIPILVDEDLKGRENIVNKATGLGYWLCPSNFRKFAIRDGHRNISAIALEDKLGCEDWPVKYTAEPAASAALLISKILS